MDGLLLIHASSGHILYSKAYAEGYGLNLSQAGPEGADAGAEAGRAKDPLVAAMLLANFLCAFYTNVVNLIDTDAIMAQEEHALTAPHVPLSAAAIPPDPTDASSFASSSSSSATAAELEARRERRLQQLMRDPLRCFDTGSDGPLLFFRRHQQSNVFCALFLRRSLLSGQGSGMRRGDSGSPDVELGFSGLDCELGDAPPTLLSMEGCGEWLAAALLRSFVSTHSSILCGVRPFRSGGSTKAFKAWGARAEELYTTAFSQRLVQGVLGHVAGVGGGGHGPEWAYASYSEKGFLRGMEEEQRTKHATAAAAAAQMQIAHQQKGAAAAAAAASPAAAVPPRPSTLRALFKRRVSGSKAAVADAPNGLAVQPGAPLRAPLVPRPPAHPSPAAIAAAAAAASAQASASSGVPVLPASSSPSTSPAPIPRHLLSAAPLFPFAPPPPPPRRRWWHFGRKKHPENSEEPELFFQRLGRTNCFYSMPGGATGGTEEVEGEEDEGEEGARPAEAAGSEASAAVDVASAPTASPAAAASSALPSPPALRRLLALVHQAGLLLAAPASVGDQLTAMEVVLAAPVPVDAAAVASVESPGAKGAPPAAGMQQDPLPSAPLTTASSSNSSSTRLWVFRVHDLLLCFPTLATPSQSPPPLIDASGCLHESPPAAAAAAAASLRHPGMPELLASLRPLLRCLDVHYAFVAELQLKAERALQRSMEKMSQEKQAAAANAAAGAPAK